MISFLKANKFGALAVLMVIVGLLSLFIPVYFHWNELLFVYAVVRKFWYVPLLLSLIGLYLDKENDEGHLKLPAIFGIVASLVLWISPVFTKLARAVPLNYHFSETLPDSVGSGITQVTLVNQTGAGFHRVKIDLDRTNGQWMLIENKKFKYCFTQAQAGVLDGDEFDIDDYTIQVTKEVHAETKRAVDNIKKPGTHHTNQWVDFFDRITDADGELTITNEAARRRTLNKMYSLHNDIAKFDLNELRPHPTQALGPKRRIKTSVEYKEKFSRGGSTVDNLYKIDTFDGAVDWADPTSAKTQRWKRFAKRATAKGGRRLARAVPVLGAAINAWGVFWASADIANGQTPTQAISQHVFDGQISQEALDLFVEGYAPISLDLTWLPFTTGDYVTFANGKSLHEGQTITVMAHDPRRPGVIGSKEIGEVFKITRLAVRGFVDVEFKDAVTGQVTQTQTLDIRDKLIDYTDAPLGISFTTWTLRQCRDAN